MDTAQMTTGQPKQHIGSDCPENDLNPNPQWLAVGKVGQPDISYGQVVNKGFPLMPHLICPCVTFCLQQKNTINSTVHKLIIFVFIHLYSAGHYPTMNGNFIPCLRYDRSLTEVKKYTKVIKNI